MGYQKSNTSPNKWIKFEILIAYIRTLDDTTLLKKRHMNLVKSQSLLSSNKDIQEMTTYIQEITMLNKCIMKTYTSITVDLLMLYYRGLFFLYKQSNLHNVDF
jgi:hypothetical protein